MLAVFSIGNNNSQVLIFPKAWSLSEAVKVSNLYLPASKLDYMTNGKLFSLMNFKDLE